MHPYRLHAHQGVFLAGLALSALTACGGDTDPTEPLPPGNLDACQLQSGTEWTWTVVGTGQKPALSVDPQGVAHIAFMLESFSGFIAYASVSAASAVSAPETVATGYFYGPIGIERRNGQPVIAYHDHTLEDQVLAVRSNGTWALHTMTNVGHDGWYNALAVDPGGSVHTATYDPSGFGGVGVNYGVWDGSAWNVEVAVPGSFDYAGGMSVGLADDGTSYVAFFDDVQGVARLAWRDAPAGAWSDKVLEARGSFVEAGRFPDLVIDQATETLHMVYLVRSSGSAGVIRYAQWNAGAVTLMDVAPVDDFTIGMTGARDIATLALDGSGQPVVAIQNRSALTVARWNGSDFDLESFPASAGTTLRQQTAIAVDAANRTHVAYWLETGTESVVCHGVSSGTP